MKEPKEKKVRTMKVGTHKKSVLLLWAVLLASTSFGVYKNFTAIDTHTVHEKEIIQLKLNDTNGIENFVKNFAKAYYTWDTSKEAIEARTTEISKYLTKELQDLNADTIRTDIPTSATVTNVLVWNVEQSGTDDFTVDYEVDQQVKEGEQTQAVVENYTVTVHVDKVQWSLPKILPLLRQYRNQSMSQKHRKQMSVLALTQLRTLPLSWKHSSNCTLPLRRKNLPTMSKTVCLLLYPAIMYFQNW